jgi:ketosteroid isomerase-like protein
MPTLSRREVLRVACVLAASFPARLTETQEPLRQADLQPTVALPSELARVLTDYERLWAHGDSAALADLFTKDGIVLSPGNQMVRGRAAIERFYRGPGGPLSLRAVAFAVGGRLGYIIGGFSRQATAPDIGKFTLTLRRDPSGRWLIQSDMDNGNSR